MTELHRRKSNRLKGYDYSQNGTYDIIVCVENRREILGGIVGAVSMPPLP